MEKKQTAVDWLMDKLAEANAIDFFSDIDELVVKAKAMETVQIIEAYANGSNDRLKNRINEQYYNETYGK